MERRGALVVVGSGPGVGAHVATVFGQNGFHHIVLMSRNLQRLSDDAMIVKTMAPSARVHIVSVDLDKISEIENSLKKVDQCLGRMAIECVFFNAAKPQMGGILEQSSQNLRRDFHVSVVSLHAIMRWAVPHFLDLARSSSTCKPTLLVTSGNHINPASPDWFSLTACRAAQKDMVASYSKEYGPKGIHCGLVVVQNTVSASGLICSAPLVAEDAWNMYRRAASLRDSEVQVRLPKLEDEAHTELAGDR